MTFQERLKRMGPDELQRAAQATVLGDRTHAAARLATMRIARELAWATLDSCEREDETHCEA